MPCAAERLNQFLLALNQDAQPEWDALYLLWIDTLLEFDGMPEEHVLDRLGGPLRRRDREALVRDVERSLLFLSQRMDDPSVTVSWQ